MELNFKNFKIGYSEKVYFNFMENDSHAHTCTLKLMSTPNQESFVIIYQWVNHRSEQFNDREEAFYIDGITPESYELAKNIFLDVYNELTVAFRENPNLEFDMSPCVERVLQKYKSKSI